MTFFQNQCHFDGKRGNFIAVNSKKSIITPGIINLLCSTKRYKKLNGFVSDSVAYSSW